MKTIERLKAAIDAARTHRNGRGDLPNNFLDDLAAAARDVGPETAAAVSRALEPFNRDGRDFRACYMGLDAVVAALVAEAAKPPNPEAPTPDAPVIELEPSNVETTHTETETK